MKICVLGAGSWGMALTRLLANNGHEFKELQITNWSFDQGPVVVSQSVKMYDDFLEIAIKSGNTTLMATTAGLMLEKICQNLSIELRIDIKRVRDDKYTIGDLWPGIRKQLKKSKELETLVESINNSLYIRNLLACHYNEWAIALSLIGNYLRRAELNMLLAVGWEMVETIIIK